MIVFVIGIAIVLLYFVALATKSLAAPIVDVTPASTSLPPPSDVGIVDAGQFSFSIPVPPVGAASVPGQARLPALEIAQLAANAGFAGPDLATAVAIAMAESAGNPSAYNAEEGAGTLPGLGSYGLWQIYLRAHPEFSGRNLFDPQQNALAAYRVYRDAGYSFHPWSTYTGGEYMAFLADAQSAAGQVS